ncbi:MULTISPECIES: FAD-dependent oxidoreductase [Sorangium]|uniref:Pyridine nucleotide-disulfide oxidoreductase n=1 Tax=Sorangium cellulosum TaxID=56 RepID=A0A4P2QNY1_SORCE|nr:MULTISPECIES: FAD-binding protein [Sorangium]AUX31203.1 pyridine nucleotide-disulfide oxidoreductase [Sorangium cellulosum]WCQ90585.1 Fumarate reductase flavoprotein subunit [Sorangium sp. Soce836]
MSTPATPSPPRASEIDDVADVLVIGGGPAGAWAALGAVASGARSVALVDKGYCGTSGATAPANTGAWYVTPEGDARERAIEARFARSGGLAHRDWMARVLDATWEQINLLAAWGYPFPLDDSGLQYRANLRGPDYMYFLRRQLRRAGVRILDHAPALELLVSDGAVAGAAGHARQQDAAWRIRAGAVVLASGGCAFLSKALGCDVNTGDGTLMAAEVGAELSGMEFSAQYGISPAYASVTKGLPYFWATFTTESGEVIDSRGNRMLALARALRHGPVYAVLDRAGPEIQRWLRDGQPNCFLPHDRLGIDPFKQRFPVTLRSEGTVRGSGGIRIVDDACATGVPGLYAAGDAASRELIVGASSGGGSPNAAWAISSGTWAGRAAAQFAQRLGDRAAARAVRPAGTVGLRPGGAAGGPSAKEIIDVVQQEVLPLDKNLFRRGDRLAASVERLEGAWRDAEAHLHAAGAARVRAREAAALLATARFCYGSALARAESRGLHQRTDLPHTDPDQAHCLATGGLSSIWVEPRRPPHGSGPPAPDQGDLA